MNQRNCACALWGSLFFGVLSAFAEETGSVVRIACVRGSHLYHADEKAEFDVTSSETGTPVTVSFSRAYLPPITTVVTTTPARVSFSLGEPGFVVCTARERLPSGQLGKPVAVGAGFDPEDIRTAMPPPADYDAFWKSAFAEQDAIAPDFTSKPLSNGVELVSCKTVWGTRMYGFLSVPKGAGPFPLQVTVGGGDSKFCTDVAVGRSADMAKSKRALLLIHLPAWEPTARTRDEANARHKAWLTENGIDGALFNWNADKGPRERWYYRCILGSCRLVEYAATRPAIDRSRVYYVGASTGGGYGVFLAAFSPYIRAAVCEVPNYGNVGGPSVGRPSGEDDRGAHWQTSLYYDTAYCAPRITCPVFMSCGYTDSCCCPETVYCIYNALNCRKVMYDKVENGHGDRPKGYGEVKKAWLESTFGM